MALDLYWQQGRTLTWIGSLEISNELTDLLHRFSQATGVSADPYGKGRLYLSQWSRLLAMAPASGYPARLLEAVQARIPAPPADGLIILEGD